MPIGLVIDIGDFLPVITLYPIDIVTVIMFSASYFAYLYQCTERYVRLIMVMRMMVRSMVNSGWVSDIGCESNRS